MAKRKKDKKGESKPMLRFDFPTFDFSQSQKGLNETKTADVKKKTVTKKVLKKIPKKTSSFDSETSGYSSGQDKDLNRLGGTERLSPQVSPIKKDRKEKILSTSANDIQEDQLRRRQEILDEQKKANAYMMKLREKARQRAKKFSGPIEYLTKEIVLDEKGRPRQAGANDVNGAWIQKFRIAGERSLYFFLKGVLNKFFLTPHFHRDVCYFLQKIPAFRKLVLMPREHAKTAIVAGGLPLHIIIQPAAENLYFPGLEGSECRIVLAGETLKMAKKNLRVLESVHTNNDLFRALWPHRVWESPRRQAGVWNSEALIFPRMNEWPDPTIWAIGVDGAITGSRPNAMIKDDLVSVEAANSKLVMDGAIQWHKDSRALLDSYEIESGLRSLEFTIGTRWAVYDLYSEMLDNDLSVEVIDERYWKIIDNGKILWPEKHTLDSIAQLQRDHKHMFFLLYLNSANDPTLTDFDLELVREFKLVDGCVLFDQTEEDMKMLETVGKSIKQKREATKKFLDEQTGKRLTPRLMEEMLTRADYFRFKAD